MEPTNPELAAILARLRERDRGQPVAVLSWAVKIQYCPSRDDACALLADLPVSQRIGIVDRTTSAVWARKSNVNLVVETLRDVSVTSEGLRHVGSIGTLKKRDAS